MKELSGDIWIQAEKRKAYVVVPTNGTIKANGCAVMGRGLAKQAARRFPKLPKIIGTRIKLHGNVITVNPRMRIVTFPVKHNWWERANLALIFTSADCLVDVALLAPNKTFLIPRVGCGNGRLSWNNVKPVLQKVFNGIDNIIVCDRVR